MHKWYSFDWDVCERWWNEIFLTIQEFDFGICNKLLSQKDFFIILICLLILIYFVEFHEKFISMILKFVSIYVF